MNLVTQGDRRRRAAAGLQRLAADRPVPPGHRRLRRRPVVRVLHLLGRPRGGRAAGRQRPGLRPRRRRLRLGAEGRQGRPEHGGGVDAAARRPDRLGRAHRRRRVRRRRRHDQHDRGQLLRQGLRSAPTRRAHAPPSATSASADSVSSGSAWEPTAFSSFPAAPRSDSELRRALGDLKEIELFGAGSADGSARAVCVSPLARRAGGHGARLGRAAQRDHRRARDRPRLPGSRRCAARARRAA